MGHQIFNTVRYMIQGLRNQVNFYFIDKVASQFEALENGEGQIQAWRKRNDAHVLIAKTSVV